MAPSERGNSSLKEKRLHLHAALRTMGRVAVAFSGGVDSTFLLHSACEALGAGNVVALQGLSCLVARSASERAEQILRESFAGKVEYIPLQLLPLSWPDFAVNDTRRCYFCKRRLYRAFLVEVEKKDCRLLLDGTNVDDLKADRPGLQAVRELGVRTPLLDAGLAKNDIRRLAAVAGLANHDLPANSCLATRITTGRTIEQRELEQIERAEDRLAALGFVGCRVRPFEEYVLLEVREEDIKRCLEPSTRFAIQRQAVAMGFGQVYLGIVGR